MINSTGCEKKGCCCLTDKIHIKQSLLELQFSGPVTGHCDGNSSESGYATLDSLFSTSVNFTWIGQLHLATKHKHSIVIENLDDVNCTGNGNGSCVLGLCLNGDLSCIFDYMMIFGIGSTVVTPRWSFCWVGANVRNLSHNKNPASLPSNREKGNTKEDTDMLQTRSLLPLFLVVFSLYIWLFRSHTHYHSAVAL